MRSWAFVGAVTLAVLAAWSGLPAGADAEHRDAVPYTATGTATHGSTAGCANAPTLRPGQYRDGLTAGKDLWFRVDKRADQVLDVSATVVFNALVRSGSTLSVGAGPLADDNANTWLFDKTTVQGGPIVSAGGRAGALGAGQTSACVRIGNGLTTSSQQVVPLPIEIVVAFNDTKPETPTPPTGVVTQGFTFADPNDVQPDGNVRSNLAIGEFPVWRVYVGHGETLSVRGVLDHPSNISRGTTERFWVRVYNNVREHLRCPAKSGAPTSVPLLSGGTHVELECGPWTVDRTRAHADHDYTIPGYYYLMVGVEGMADNLEGRVLPYDLDILVTDNPSVPKTSGDTRESTGTPTAGATGTASGLTGGRPTGGASAGTTGEPGTTTGTIAGTTAGATAGSTAGTTQGAVAGTSAAATTGSTAGTTAAATAGAAAGATAGTAGTTAGPGAHAAGDTRPDTELVVNTGASSPTTPREDPVNTALFALSATAATTSVIAFTVYRRRRAAAAEARAAEA